MSSTPSSIVYVHGISEHAEGYSDVWHQALEPHLSHAADKHEVRWSDIVNAMAMSYGDGPEAAAKASEEEQLRREIDQELERRKLRNGQQPVAAVPSDAERVYGGSGFALDDFVRYMVWESTRESILSRFDDIVTPLLRGGHSLSIIAHSWGTVVSYEGLRRLDNDNLPGRVANLITLGSALSIGTVQRNLFGRVGDGRRPSLVGSFVNVDAGGDIVGGDISPPFDVDRQFLNQQPTGCSTFWLRRRTARSFTCAHSSYFRPENLTVQRDIVAHYINNAASGR